MKSATGISQVSARLTKHKDNYGPDRKDLHFFVKRMHYPTNCVFLTGEKGLVG